MGAKAIEPGKYTVILEPAAVDRPVCFMCFGFDARQADEGRTFISKAGGGNKKGEKIVDERVNIYSDPPTPTCPRCPGPATAGRARSAMWIENGRGEEPLHPRATGRRRNAHGAAAPRQHASWRAAPQAPRT